MISLHGAKILENVLKYVFKIVKISLGFVIHSGKSVFVPTHNNMGFVINLVTMTVSLTELKQKSLAELGHDFISKK